jgi:1,4-alpha-glucan branching enzyme
MDQPQHQQWIGFYRQLLKLRREHIVPLLSLECEVNAAYQLHGERGLTAEWKFADVAALALAANLGDGALAYPAHDPAQTIYTSPELGPEALTQATLPAWSVVWSLQR